MNVPSFRVARNGFNLYDASAWTKNLCGLRWSVVGKSTWSRDRDNRENGHRFGMPGQEPVWKHQVIEFLGLINSDRLRLYADRVLWYGLWRAMDTTERLTSEQWTRKQWLNVMAKIRFRETLPEKTYSHTHTKKKIKNKDQVRTAHQKAAITPRYFHNWDGENNALNWH